MTAQHDLDRALGAWFGVEAVPAPPPEPLVRVIESTRTIRPRPALTARVGSRWVGAGSTSGPRGGLASLRPGMVVALVALLAVALVGAAVLVGSRLVAPKTPVVTEGYVSIFLRRDDGPDPGISVFAVRPDGGEALVRHVSDSIVSGGEKLTEWDGTVSTSGWLALGTEWNGAPWPVVLIDLGDPNAKPWVVPEASSGGGGAGPRWGPTGLLAATVADLGHLMVIADPETHSTWTFSTRDGPVGGAIVWTPDGSGIVAATGTGDYGYETVPIDGGAASPGVGEVFDARGEFGRGLARLRICEPGTYCPGGDDGRVERVLDGSTQTIWQQVGEDRAFAASFVGPANEYWLTTDHDSGRQVALIHLKEGRQDVVAIVNRDAAWQFVAVAGEAPDKSMVLASIIVADKPAAALVPVDGAPQSFHSGYFAGFVDSASSAVFATGQYAAPPEIMPAAGKAYGLPPLEELIAADRTVLGKASRDAVEGEKGARTFEVPRVKPPTGEAYFDCSGPSSATLTSGPNSVTNACLRSGTNLWTIDASGPITVTASGDTSWRVVIYGPPSPVEGATAPPTVGATEPPTTLR